MISHPLPSIPPSRNKTYQPLYHPPHQLPHRHRDRLELGIRIRSPDGRNRQHQHCRYIRRFPRRPMQHWQAGVKVFKVQVDPVAECISVGKVLDVWHHPVRLVAQVYEGQHCVARVDTDRRGVGGAVGIGRWTARAGSGFDAAEGEWAVGHDGFKV